MRRARLLAKVLLAEGIAGTAARVREHLAESRRRATFRRVPVGALPAVPVLQVTGVRRVPWLGGVSAQLGARLVEHERSGPTALLYPCCDRLRVEATAGSRRVAAELPLLAAEDRSRNPGWVDAIRAVAAALGARLIHVEGAAGLPHASLVQVARQQRMLLSLHDFALFCPRPNLFDERLERTCGGCHDETACRLRLESSGHCDAGAAEGWRQTGTALLRACHTVVYSSEFLLREHVRLFGHAGPRARVIAPGIDLRTLPSPPSPDGRLPGPARIAFVGGGHCHKGASMLARVVAEWSRSRLPPVEWEVLGGGGLDRLRELRRLPGVRVRGYYRHGSLPRLLVERRIDLCLLLPQLPESFSLTLSEVLAAGVPALALGTGALPDRLEAGGGMLLPPDASVDVVVDALRCWLSGTAPVPPAAAPPPSASAAAAGFGALHAELLAEDPGPVAPGA